MKRRRHEAILKLIKDNAVTTQEELQSFLKDAGFDITQATVSRDIKELRLIKTMDGGNYRYTVTKERAGDLTGKYIGIFSNAVISIDTAMNDMVIKCYSGMANAACAALDSMNLDGVVGTLAGDDTIFVILRDEEAARLLCAELEQLIAG